MENASSATESPIREDDVANVDRIDDVDAAWCPAALARATIAAVKG